MYLQSNQLPEESFTTIEIFDIYRKKRPTVIKLLICYRVVLLSSTKEKRR